eukprot:11177412-Lingulodinium_polyedra.AAC.1
MHARHVSLKRYARNGWLYAWHVVMWPRNAGNEENVREHSSRAKTRIVRRRVQRPLVSCQRSSGPLL